MQRVAGRRGGAGHRRDTIRGHNKIGKIATTLEGMNPHEEGSNPHLNLHLQVVVEAHPCQHNQKRSFPRKIAWQVTPNKALILLMRLIKLKASLHLHLIVRNLPQTRSFMTIIHPLSQRWIFSTGLKSRVRPAIEVEEAEHEVAPNDSSALDLMIID